MQAITRSEINSGLTPQVKELIKTIVSAAAALQQLISIEEFEHGFEFHWGHFSSQFAIFSLLFIPLLQL
jgi:hypothetical protein